jgi:hypothetical protein
LDGLPLFIKETWAWGPSVPNYGVSFPHQNIAITQEMPAVRAAMGEAEQLYVRHSQKQGVPYHSTEETLRRLSDIQRRFWQSAEEFVKSEWLLWWRVNMRQLRALKLPNADRERILNLKRMRQ